MKTQVLVINGGNSFDKYEDYISYLKTREVTLDNLRSKDWKSTLGQNLGANFDVLAPQMPNNRNARYYEWKIWFERIIPLLLDKEVILIGHSLGGIFLAKYLSENNFPHKIIATFLVSAPFNTEHQHPLIDFIISKNLDKFNKQGGKIFLYHSKDDEVVPFSNLSSYEDVLPGAEVRILDKRGHFNMPNFPELLEDLRNLAK